MTEEYICCACLKPTTDKNLILVDRRAPIPGTGWKCNLCHTEHDGAVALLCNECFGKLTRCYTKQVEPNKLYASKQNVVKYVIRGDIHARELTLIDGLEHFKCDPIKHAMEEKKIIEEHGIQTH